MRKILIILAIITTLKSCKTKSCHGVEAHPDYHKMKTK
jgi:hypothetical protein